MTEERVIYVLDSYTFFFFREYFLSYKMSDVYCNLPGTLKSQIFNLCIYTA